MTRFRQTIAALAPALTLAALATAAMTPALVRAQHAGHGSGHAAHHAQKDTAASAHAASGWKALDDYHGSMMASWHPAKRDGNLAPARQVAAAMAKQADVLAAATLPARCDTPAVKSAIADVKTQTHAFAGMVAAKQDDATLKAALAALHERFEVVEHGCSAPGH